ncbi:MAG: ABC transporter ATP-binding protein [Hespellia sp.]|nr:ABC transporter ATP-binding protein [Hespellia sp.]
MEQHKEDYVRLKNINKTFQDYKASDQISFSIAQGSLIGLLGPSGSGKTTILRMIAGLESADSGDIIINGRVVNDVPASKRGIGFVFQSYALFRYMTVYDNIAFGLTVNKWKKPDIRRRVDELIELVGLKGLEKRFPNQLSGGQRQRVAFARALAPNPELLLLDEPFAAIDAKVRQELRSWLREMITNVGITSIFVTHDQDEAVEVADQIIVTNQGRVEQIGTPIEIYRNPQTPFVAQFIGNPIQIANVHQFKGFDYAREGQRAVIRPENISVTKRTEQSKYPVSVEDGVVEGVLFRGSKVELKIRIGQELVTAIRGVDEAAIAVGELVHVFIYRMYAYQGAAGKEAAGVQVLENEILNTANMVYL